MFSDLEFCVFCLSVRGRLSGSVSGLVLSGEDEASTDGAAASAFPSCADAKDTITHRNTGKTETAKRRFRNLTRDMEALLTTYGPLGLFYDFKRVHANP